MKQKIPVTWEVCGFIEIEANSIKEAIEKFNQDPDMYELPANGEYVDDSFTLSTENEEEIKIMCNSDYKTMF